MVKEQQKLLPHFYGISAKFIAGELLLSRAHVLFNFTRLIYALFP